MFYIKKDGLYFLSSFPHNVWTSEKSKAFKFEILEEAEDKMREFEGAYLIPDSAWLKEAFNNG
jgi:hypothetical protein